MLKNKKRLLITGGSGLLGSNWACITRDYFDVYLAIFKKNVQLFNTKPLITNFNNYEKTFDTIKKLSIDIIIHCAGLANVDECEKNIKKAIISNVEITDNISKIANELNIKMVHISTDHLFEGLKSFYKEIETPRPLNNYGLTKYLAEQKVIKNSKDALIIRTNFFGLAPPYRNTLYSWIKNSLLNNKKIFLFEDVFFSPIAIDSLVDITHELLALDQKGIINVVGDERVSKKQFGLRLANYYNFTSELIISSKVDQIGLKAKRPADMSLSNLKLKNILGRKIGSIESFFDVIESVKLKNRQFDLDNIVVERLYE